MLEQLRKGAGTWVAKIFIALLVMSFAVWGIADIFNGYGGRDIATIGTTKISGEEFRQAYETQVSNMSRRFGRRLTTQQAQQLRIDQQVLSTLIGTAALNQQAQRPQAWYYRQSYCPARYKTTRHSADLTANSAVIVSTNS